MFVKNSSVTRMAGVVLGLGATLLAVPSPAVRAAPVVPMAAVVTAEEGVEPAGKSRILALTLPEGANRLTSAEEMAKFDQELQEAARSLKGTVTRSEVLMWTGDAAKSVIGDFASQMKAMGYSIGETKTFETEMGRVTPVGAMRGDTSDSILGTWIETKGVALLIWGRFKPDAAPVTVTARPKTAAAPKKAAAAQKKVAVAAKAKPGKSSASKAARPETDAERQAKAFQAYKDYQYVKLLGPISGPMYRSTKW